METLWNRRIECLLQLKFDYKKEQKYISLKKDKVSEFLDSPKEEEALQGMYKKW